MQYALLIYGDEHADANATQQEQEAVMAAYNAFGNDFKEQIAGGEALMPTNTATTVRVRDGKTLTTDGPFAETKEQQRRLSRRPQNRTSRRAPGQRSSAGRW